MYNTTSDRLTKLGVTREAETAAVILLRAHNISNRSILLHDVVSRQEYIATQLEIMNIHY